MSEERSVLCSVARPPRSSDNSLPARRRDNGLAATPWDCPGVQSILVRQFRSHVTCNRVEAALHSYLDTAWPGHGLHSGVGMGKSGLSRNAVGYRVALMIFPKALSVRV